METLIKPNSYSDIKKGMFIKYVSLRYPDDNDYGIVTNIEPEQDKVWAKWADSIEDIKLFKFQNRGLQSHCKLSSMIIVKTKSTLKEIAQKINKQR